MNNTKPEFSKEDLPRDYESLKPEHQEILINWIKENFTKRKTANKRIGTSYGLKHVFQKKTGLYVTNGQFKGAMLQCGMIPEAGHENKLNWHFRVNQK